MSWPSTSATTKVNPEHHTRLQRCDVERESRRQEKEVQSSALKAAAATTGPRRQRAQAYDRQEKLMSHSARANHRTEQRIDAPTAATMPRPSSTAGMLTLANGRHTDAEAVCRFYRPGRGGCRCRRFATSRRVIEPPCNHSRHGCSPVLPTTICVTLCCRATRSTPRTMSASLVVMTSAPSSRPAQDAL